jgi:hypothetical protein
MSMFSPVTSRRGRRKSPARRQLRPARRQLRIESLETRQLLHAEPWSEVAVEGEDQQPPVADFTLADVNTSSASYTQPVSPRDYLQQVSAWYFGHAT